jgi:hypothetical protein
MSLGVHVLPPVPVIAIFTQDKGKLDRILVGLHASILQGRRLTVDADRREAWLEEMLPQPGTTATTGV